MLHVTMLHTITTVVLQHLTQCYIRDIQAQHCDEWSTELKILRTNSKTMQTQKLEAHWHIRL